MYLLTRFLQYISIETTANTQTGTTPSSSGQLKLAESLVEELKSMGMQQVQVDKNGYVTATLPSNCDVQSPVIGFISHLDTSPDFTAKNIHPQIIENYDGNDILLNREQNIILKTAEFPEVLNYIGQTIITTDGTTLLGADDKAGIAEIVTAMDYLIQHPEIKHAPIRICFTPDEEIGAGADYFDVKAFGADYAYTMDGGEIGELEYENFNAAGAHLIFHGRNVHPGYAKNKMRNAIEMANQFINLLPINEKPEHTEGYQGFYHITSSTGNVEKAELEIIIRDFDKLNFEVRKDYIKQCVVQLKKQFGEENIELHLKEQYANMREKIEPLMHIVDRAQQAMLDAGVTPKIRPIRGGTDGARLSFMGLPCPNIFAGGHNFHGRFEFVPLQSMQKAVDTIINIVSIK